MAIKPLRPLIHSNDRLDALLDMGVSPGTDDNYEVQAYKLAQEKQRTQGKLQDASRMGFLQKMEYMIQNARQSGKNSQSNAISPQAFRNQVLGKLVPAPSELDPRNIAKMVAELPDVADQVIKHPLATLKAVALNGPPEPSTLAAMAAPAGALKAYRELAPLHVRTYLHHMAGVPTPFNAVTETERQALAHSGQTAIDNAMADLRSFETARAQHLQRLNKIKLADDGKLVSWASRFGDMDYPLARKILKLYEPDDRIPNFTKWKTEDLRKYVLAREKSSGAQHGNLSYTYFKHAVLGHPKSNANVANDFKKITGNPLKSMFMNEHDFSLALGKTYVEPVVEKGTGKIVANSIKDTYKFYPEVYGFHPGEGRKALVEAVNDFFVAMKDGDGLGRASARLKRQLLGTSISNPLGVFLRKAGMKRPTSIIDIPLRDKRKLNAYDKAAILLSTANGGKEKRK